MSGWSRRSLIAGIMVAALVAGGAGLAYATRTVISYRAFAWSDDPAGIEPDHLDYPTMSPDGRIAYSFFEGSPGGTAQARVYNPTNGATSNVPVTTGDQLYPKVSGDWVVYHAEPPSGSDDTSTVWAYNLKTHVPTKISTNPNDYASDPQVYGNRAVWVQRAPADAPTLYQKNLANMAYPATPLVPTSAFRGVPSGATGNFRLDSSRLAFDRFAWGDSRYDVWLWDLSNPLNDPQNLTEGEVGRTLLRDLEGQRVAWFREHTAETTDTVVIYDRMSGIKTEIEEMTQVELLGTGAIVGDTSGGSEWYFYDYYLDELVPITTESGVFVADSGLSGWGDRFVAMTATAYNKNDLAHATVLKPVVSATTPMTVVAQGARPKVTGSVSEFGVPISGGKVRLEYSYDGKEFGADFPYVEGTTNSSGAFAITVPEAVRETIYYRAVYLGKKNAAAGDYVEHLSAASRAVKFTAPVTLGRPVVRTTRAVNKTWNTYGSIVPGLDEGSSWVRVRAYKYIRGKWRYKKSFVARDGFKDGKSVYVAPIKLTSKGKWKLKAYYPTNAAHPASFSAYSKTITVQ